MKGAEGVESFEGLGSGKWEKRREEEARFTREYLN